MSDNVRAQVRRLALDAMVLTGLIDDGLLDRIDNAMVGIKAASIESSVSHGINDPTGARAIGNRDTAAQHLIELSHCVDRSLNAIRRALVISTIYPAANALVDQEERDDGCQSCARLVTAQGTKRWEPPFVESTHLKGLLDRPMRLCQWCYRFVRTMHRIPDMDELERHHEGKRVMRKAD